MPTLLIADDHASVLHALEFVLAGPDLHVLLAHSGATAITRAEQAPIDAALVDLHMPGMDGLVVTRALKERAVRAGSVLPVWVMTAAHSVGAAEQTRQAGAEDLLKKPFDCAAFRVALLQRLNASTNQNTSAA